MKKVFFTVLFILSSFLVYAQDNVSVKKESFSDEFNREIKDIGKLSYEDYSMTIGVYGGPYFHTGYLNTLGIGGGFGAKYKFSFNRFFAISTDLGYTYSSGRGTYSTNSTRLDVNSHMFDVRILGIFQYESKKGESGFVPWVGTGPLLSIASTTESTYNVSTTTATLNYKRNYTGANIGYILAFGFRYNFKKAYAGANFDYTIVNPAYYDVSGIRLNVELGYRF